MRPLYNYIRESLLDDEDEIMDKAKDKVIENLLMDISSYICKTYHWGNISLVKFIENVLVISSDVHEFRIDNQISDMLIDLHKVRPFDEISAQHVIKFENEDLLDGKTIKTFRCANAFIGGRVSLIKGVNFDLEQPASNLRPRFSCENDSVTLEDVEVWMEEGNIRDRMRFDGIPTLKKFKAHNVSSVHIYSALAFDKASLVKKMNEFFDPTYKYVIDDVGGKMISRKGDFKTIVATVNNPRKYNPDHIIGNPFSVNKNARISDIIDLKCFDDELMKIGIANNNVEIDFTTTYGLPNSNGSYFKDKLPNDDGWEVWVYKRP
jgi:hypothetical protein